MRKSGEWPGWQAKQAQIPGLSWWRRRFRLRFADSASGMLFPTHGLESDGRSTALRYGAGVAGVAVALLARAALSPQLHGEMPFATFFAAIAAAAWVGGLGPSLLSAALGFVAGEWFFVGHGAGGTATANGLVVAGSYFLVAAAIMAVGHAAHKAGERALARQIELGREVGQRIRAEASLLKAHDELESRVRERITELNTAMEAQERDRASLAEQAALLQLAGDAILVTDMSGRISFWNRGAEELYGWPPDAAVGADVHELLRTSSPVPLNEIWAAIREQERWEGELSHFTRSGEAVTVASRWSLQRDREGKPGAVLEINRDITGRKRTERALADRIAELARSNAELQRFAYVASHDLQEPLRMVASFTQLLADRYAGKLDQDAREFIGYAVDGARRMQTLIQDLLALSQLGSRGMNFEMVRFDEAMGRAVANLQFAIRESGAFVSHDELPAAMADSSQIVQLFQVVLFAFAGT